MIDKKTVSNHSVEKAFTIIEVMAKSHGSMRLLDIAEACGMPSSTTLRMVNTLAQLGYIIQNTHDNRYRLTLKFTTIGNAVVTQTDLHAIVHPRLIRLSQACQESSCLAIEQEGAVVYIDVVMGPDTIIRTMQYIGKHAPMHCTGVGKLLLTNLSPEALDEYIRQKGLEPFTCHTIATAEALHAEIAAVRARGYAIDDEECELGARCVAAPIRDYSKRIIAGISVSGPSTRMGIDRLEALKPIICDAAAEISASLGYSQ